MYHINFIVQFSEKILWLFFGVGEGGGVWWEGGIFCIIVFYMVFKGQTNMCVYFKFLWFCLIP